MVDYIVRNHVAPRTKLHVPKDDCPILSKKSMFGDKRKRAWMYFVRQPSMIGEWMETSHCLNPGLVRHDSRCSTKIHQKVVCWVQGRLTKKQVTTRLGHIWLEEWSSMSKNPQRKASNWLNEKKNKIGRGKRTTRHLLHFGR